MIYKKKDSWKNTILIYIVTYEFFILCVAEPTTEILGGPDLYIDHGSTINLTCIVLNSPEPPAYIFWNHNDAVSYLPKPILLLLISSFSFFLFHSNFFI